MKRSWTPAAPAGSTNTFNISTVTALVAAGRHPRRQARQPLRVQCCAARFLEQLGVNLDVPPTAWKLHPGDRIDFSTSSFNTAMARIADVRASSDPNPVQPARR